MRLKKLSLVAAAGLGFALSVSAASTRLSTDTSVSNLTGAGDYILHGLDTNTASGVTLTVNNSVNTTYSGKFLGFGNVTKTGAGTLEYAGFQDTDYYNMRTFVATVVSGAGDGPRNDLMMRGAAIGDFRIKEGTVDVSGFISQYVAYRDTQVQLGIVQSLGTAWVTKVDSSQWAGFSRVILEGSAKLSFKNTALNVGPNHIKADDVVDMPVIGTKRYNFVRNLTAGVDAAGTVLNTANQTELETGPDSTYRLILDQEKNTAGAVGILSGGGRIIKTGAGSFSLLNASRFTGDLLLTNGILSLESTSPGSYTSINSVNLGSRSGNEEGAVYLNSVADSSKRPDPHQTQYEWKPRYVPGADLNEQAYLRVKGTQTIGSLQSLFWENPDDLDRPGTAALDEPYRATLGGARAHLSIDPDATLTIVQREVGYYTGSLEGGGNLVKDGAAQLVLMGSSADISGVRVHDGTLTTNLNMIGGGNIVLDAVSVRADGGKTAPRLEIIENSAVSIYAKITTGASSVVQFQTRGGVFDPKGNLYSLGSGIAPTIEFAVPQTEFAGDLVVSSGMTIVFGGQAGDDVLSRASGITLKETQQVVDTTSGTISEQPATLETTLRFKDTNQAFHNFQGDPNTAIALGRGTVTLYQDAFDTAYAGKIYGTGGFIKDGAKQFTLYGRDGTNFNGTDNTGNSKDTYSGATVVRAGTLKLDGLNQLPNSSGLILGGGTLDTTGRNQTFGALFGASNSVLNYGSATLTIGLSSARLAQVQDELRNGAGAPGYYLASDGSTFAAAFTGDTTRAYLRAVLAPGADVAAANADYINNLAFAGKLVGTGLLVKQGAERLNLTGVSTDFKGAVQVKAGTLQVNANSLPSTSGITVDSGAVFALNADSQLDAALNQVEQPFTAPVAGAGSFEKSGLGTTRLVKPLALTGGVSVREGVLLLTLEDTLARNYTTAAGATLTFDQPGALAVGGGVLSGAGVLAKAGAGALDFSAVNLSSFSGEVKVQSGTLTLHNLPTGDITVAAGTELITTVADNPVYNGKLHGSGSVKVSGGTLTLGTPSNGVADAFTGTLSMTAGTILAGQSDLYRQGVVELNSASTFNLNGTLQTLAGIKGDATSSITLGGGILAVDATGVTEFSGLLTGSGEVRKTGAGKLSLTGTVNTHWTGTATIQRGALVSTPQALGDATVVVSKGADVASPGTFSLYNADTVNATVFANAISGDGVLDKTGAGVVSVSNTGTFAGTVKVTEGELRASTGGIGGKVFPNVSVAKNAVYAVVLGQNETLDFTDGNKVEGAGSLAVEGGKTLTLQGTQLYTGNTILRRLLPADDTTAATLDLRTNDIRTLNGLDSGTTSAGLHVAGSGASTVVNAGDTLTIAQNTEGTFDGAINLTGTANTVTITGTKKLYLTNPGLLKFTVDGGHLQLAAAATNEVMLANSGTLYSTGGLYNAAKISGAGNMILSDANAAVELDQSQSAALAYSGKIGVDAGSLQLHVAGLNRTRTITGLVADKSGLEQDVTGTLKLAVDSGARESLLIGVAGSGALEKVGAGQLVINDGATPGKYLGAFTGHFTVSVGSLGGSFSTQGDLTIAAADPAVNGSKPAHLAPGNSPGIVTVNGNLTLSGQLDMEVTNRNTTAGIDFDQVVVKQQLDGSNNPISGTGIATLGGALRVTQYGSAAPIRGVGYRLITAEGGITGDFTSVDITGRRVLIVTPSRSADVNGYLYGLGSANAVTVYVVDKLGETAGYTPHEGLAGLTAELDGFVYDESKNDGTPKNALGARLAVAAPASLDATVNALSPLGYGALYAMDRETGLRQEERIRERLEQRRYDNATERNDPWEAFVVGSGALASNKAERDTPTFDYNTYGGMVGLDKKLEHGPVVGGAVGYDTGSAKLHQGAGRIEMNRVRATAFASTMVTSRWFVDGGLSAGFADFSAKRETLTGRNTASTLGYDFGANVATGTVVTLRSNLFLTPYAAVSYAHHEFDGFTEKGSTSRLKVDGWSQDSLRTSLGTGLGWWLPAGDMKVKLGLDVAYNHELLDTDSELDARFADDATGKSFRTTAAALPGDSISVGPSVSLGFDEVTSISAGYTYEMGFDGRAYNAFNIAFRRRF